ncbi:MAG: hydrogenase nickel incorporation protein HypB [Anaerolineae bacterium]|nr:hydrogenase nickel incorporation protein HypB [Anaerolineae bacterium]
MMDEIRLIDVRKNILSDNENQAELIRQRLERVFMVNVMASPGAGKTSLIIKTLRGLRPQLRMAVIEGDIESTVDSEKILKEGIPAVQIQTGGACHLDAPMIDAALDRLDLSDLDLIFIENIGNLICPAEFDTGSDLKIMILSVPEGDDKVLKYPLMFSVCDALVVNKSDYLEGSDFNLDDLRRRTRLLNPQINIFEISCKTGDGIAAWCDWLAEQVHRKRVVVN